MKIFLLFACLAICGIAVETMGAHQKRSTGGIAIPTEQAPFFVSLRRKFRHVCGGALITKIHVLTAAHCIMDELNQPYNNTVILCGLRGSDKKSSSRKMQWVGRPSDYKYKSLQYNIAIIKLVREAPINKWTSPIQLTKMNPMRHMPATLISMDTSTNTRSSHLKQLEVTIATTSQCSACRSDGSIFCGTVGNFSSTYAVDSGSPLIQNGTVIGIASWPCEEGSNCHTFTNVFEFLYLIEDAISL